MNLRFPLAGLLILSVVLTGCISARRTPNLGQIFAAAKSQTGKRPVIVIPGILGSELIDSKTGIKVWPSAFRTTKEGLPISPELAANNDDLVPGKIIETLKLSRVLPEVYVYRDLLEALRNYAGYHDGDWENPKPDGDKDTFYVFAYDWRRDNVSNARELVRRIERLKEKLQRPDLKFNIVAHSMGGLIARYAAMYGNADLPDDDRELKPTWAGAKHIRKIVMIGVPNEGSLDAFATLIDGYSITEGLRRRVPLLNKLTAEDAVTAPAVFQLLPHARTAKFVDENLKPVQVDLYDAAVWKRYGWSPLFSDQFTRKYASSIADEVKVSPADAAQRLYDYLVVTLKRARKFHQALDAIDINSSPVTLLAIGGDCEETLSAALLLRDPKRDRWLTVIRPREYRTSGGLKISKQQVTEALYAPGDGRVTRASLLGENIARGRNDSNTSGLPLHAVFGCDLHGQLQRNKSLQDNALTAIVNETLQ